MEEVAKLPTNTHTHTTVMDADKRNQNINKKSDTSHTNTKR